MKTLIVGLGNPILGDDGVGWKVVEQLQSLCASELSSGRIEMDCLALGGISLMERLIGYERTILVDAIVTGQHPIGTVLCFELAELPNRAIGHMSSAHDTTLPNALQVGRMMGAQLPEQITIVAIESQSVYDFSEELTPAVAASVPVAVDAVMELVGLPRTVASHEKITKDESHSLSPAS